MISDYWTPNQNFSFHSCLSQCSWSPNFIFSVPWSTYFILVSLFFFPFTQLAKQEVIQILKVNEHCFIFLCSKALTLTPFRVCSSYLRLPCARPLSFRRKFPRFALRCETKPRSCADFPAMRNSPDECPPPRYWSLFVRTAMARRNLPSPPAMPEPSTSSSTGVWKPAHCNADSPYPSRGRPVGRPRTIFNIPAASHFAGHYHHTCKPLRHFWGEGDRYGDEELDTGALAALEKCP